MNKSNHSPARPDWWQFAEDCTRRYHLYHRELQQTRRKTLKEDAPDGSAGAEEPLVPPAPDQPHSLLHHLSKLLPFQVPSPLLVLQLFKGHL